MGNAVQQEPDIDSSIHIRWQWNKLKVHHWNTRKLKENNNDLNVGHFYYPVTYAIKHPHENLGIPSLSGTYVFRGRCELLTTEKNVTSSNRVQYSPKPCTKHSFTASIGRQNERVHTACAFDVRKWGCSLQKKWIQSWIERPAPQAVPKYIDTTVANHSQSISSCLVLGCNSATSQVLRSNSRPSS